MVLFFATGNEGKFREVKVLAEKFGIEIEHSRIPYLEIQANDLSDVAKVGVQQVFGILKAPCFVEDSGLFITPLRGFPGPYSKYVFLTIGNRGVLKLMEGMEDRRAVFRSSVGYCGREGKPLIFEGKAEGRISLEERGSGGFGFDPIFIPDEGDGRTFAEIPVEEKNVLSHRGRAMEGFFKWYLLHKEE